MSLWSWTAVLSVCSLILCILASNGSASYQEANCTQIEAHGDLQEVLINVSLTQPSNTCVQVNIAPGSYVISQVLNISQNVALQGMGGDVNIAFKATKPVGYEASQPFYVVQFLDTSFAAFSDIHFTSGSGIIGFENVTEVRITNCTFSYFVEGAVDIYNCDYPTITNCTFQHNGPASVIKQQPFRGHSAGLSIAFYYLHSVGYQPLVLVSKCLFVNNSAIGDTTAAQSAVNVLQKRIFFFRGGGAAVLLNTFDSVWITLTDCVFINNTASSQGGGLVLVYDGMSNHSISVSKTSFQRNRSYVAAGAISVGFLDPGSLTKLHSLLVYDTTFTGNTAPIGGAVFFFTNVIAPANGQIGDYGYFRNCSFQQNVARDFGATIAVSSALVLSNREQFKPMEIINCTFTGNEIYNSGGGIFGAAYVSIIFKGMNIFSENSGTSILLVGSVMRIANGGSLQLTNNTNTVKGGALYLLSLGQIVVNDNVQIIFDSNNGSFGASVVSEGNIPNTLQHVPNNTLCFFQHTSVSSNPVPLAARNVSILFRNNIASVGAALYVENVRTCTFHTQEAFASNFATYDNNMNTAHEGDEYNLQWNIQTPPAAVQVQNRSLLLSTYAGGLAGMYVSIYDELSKPVTAIFRLLDITALNTYNQTDDASYTYQFQKSLILYNNLYEETFDTTFLVPSSTAGQRTIQIFTLEQTHQLQSMFQVEQLPCPLGNILSPQDNGLSKCECNSRNPSIADCSNTTVIFPIYPGGRWGGASNSINGYGDMLVTYPCPMGYCHCCIVDQGAIVTCLFSVESTNLDSQCDVHRTGVLCGNCVVGLGVSALLNECVTCSNASGLLIAGLIIGNAVAILLLIIFGVHFPSWLHPCIFYLQLLPYITEHFPVPFSAVHHYLYYVSSGLSFYFVYDFCLYSNMSPLVSYFIRYLPLFTAIIICPIVLAIRQKKNPHAPWHGLKWIVVLMYTHVVHTSMSILNCPRLPGSDGNIANVWYINGNTECFTGWHIPLAILAMLVLILCVAIIPLIEVAAYSKMIPTWARVHVYNLIPTVTNGYKDKVKWFGSVDLLRRIIMVLLVVALPGDEYSSIFVTIIILTIYGYVQPYKHTLSNVMEVVLAVDVLIMLLIKNTNQIHDQLLGLPPQPASVLAINSTSVCTDDDNIVGVSPLVILLTPFYYFPLAVTLVGGGCWAGHSICCYMKLKWSTSDKHPSLLQEKPNYVNVYDELVDDAESLGHNLYNLPLLNIQDSTLPLSTPYTLHDASV